MELWLSIFGSVVSLAGLLVGIYTLWKVKKVGEAQIEERRITQEMLGIDQIELDLRRVITKLTESKDRESAALATDLSIKLGAIQGARRAMEQPAKLNPVMYVRLERGFFTHEFLISHIDHARTNIDIITGRTLLVAGYDVMDRLRRACERGVEVRLTGLSENADKVTLTDALQTVASPAPADAEAYRQQIIQCKNDVIAAVNSWPDPAVRARFQYRVNTCVPRVSLVRTDNHVSLGFLQFFRDAQPKELKDREYIQVLATSGVGQVAMTHFELCWKEGTQILPPDNTADNSAIARVNEVTT
jgi:hypothetical protein